MCQLLNVSLILVWICDGDILTIFSLFFSQLRADVVPKTAGEECWLCVYVCVLVRHARVCMRAYVLYNACVSSGGRKVQQITVLTLLCVRVCSEM